MPKNVKILVACTNGAGTSLMMKMSVEKATKELGMAVERIHHCALAEGKSSASQYDIAFVPLNFVDMFKHAQSQGTTVIGLRNVLSSEEVKEKLRQTDFVPTETPPKA
ncbi:MAG: PTS sugar transporter subunit IIB [Spirochaetaceae bacterium]|jgi:PTS system ascorbate-specific IIB component|nr:PTS sugar transporter subunit IIB [Spirochaetaceae bacterium]